MPWGMLCFHSVIKLDRNYRWQAPMVNNGVWAEPLLSPCKKQRGLSAKTYLSGSCVYVSRCFSVSWGHSALRWSHQIWCFLSDCREKATCSVKSFLVGLRVKLNKILYDLIVLPTSRGPSMEPRSFTMRALEDQVHGGETALELEDSEHRAQSWEQNNL